MEGGWVDSEDWEAAMRPAEHGLGVVIQHRDPPVTCACGRLLHWAFDGFEAFPGGTECDYFWASCRCGTTHTVLL